MSFRGQRGKFYTHDEQANQPFPQEVIHKEDESNAADSVSTDSAPTAEHAATPAPAAPPAPPAPPVQRPPVVHREAAATANHIGITVDAWDKRVSVLGNYLQHAAGPSQWGPAPTVDQGALGQTQDMTLMEMATEVVTKELGRKPTGRSEVFRHAFASTGTFPKLLEDAMNKRLLAMYGAAPATWRAISRVVSAPNFQDINFYGYDGTPKLELLRESGEVRQGDTFEESDSYQVKTYAKAFSVTRNAVINDDLGFLSRKPAEFAQAAVTLESDTVWGLITGNTNVFGGKLFQTGSGRRGNTGSANTFTAAAIGAAIASMATKKDRNGNTILGLQAATLVTSEARRFAASQILAGALTPNETSEVVPGYVGSLNLITEPRLDLATQPNIWYLFAGAGMAPVIEAAYLRGSAAPQIMREESHSPLGMTMTAVHDFGAKVVDYYGVYRSALANS